MSHLENDNIRKAVREQYGNVADSGQSGCGCSTTSCCSESVPDAKDISMELGYSSTIVNSDSTMGVRFFTAMSLKYCTNDFVF